MMKKFLISLLLILLMASISYGAASEDVYLRRDVFDAKMDALISRMDALEKSINTRFDALSSRVDSLEKVMNNSFAAMDKRIGDLQTTVYWGFSILGLLIAVIAFAPAFAEFVKNVHKPEFATLEDVKRLIAESKLEAK